MHLHKNARIQIYVLRAWLLKINVLHMQAFLFKLPRARATSSNIEPYEIRHGGTAALHTYIEEETKTN